MPPPSGVSHKSLYGRAPSLASAGRRYRPAARMAGISMKRLRAMSSGSPMPTPFCQATQRCMPRHSGQPARATRLVTPSHSGCCSSDASSVANVSGGRRSSASISATCLPRATASASLRARPWPETPAGVTVRTRKLLPGIARLATASGVAAWHSAACHGRRPARASSTHVSYALHPQPGAECSCSARSQACSHWRLPSLLRSSTASSSTVTPRWAKMQPTASQSQGSALCTGSSTDTSGAASTRGPSVEHDMRLLLCPDSSPQHCECTRVTRRRRGP